jgi:hypothetical protein
VTRARASILLVLAAACVRGGQTSSAPSPASPADFDSLTITEVAPGVVHRSVRDLRGPWAIQLLEIDLALCKPMLRASKPGPPLAVRATTSSLGSTSLAAINADFFMLPGGTPVGPHVEAGEVLVGPGLRPAFLISRDGWSAGRTTIVGTVTHGSDNTALAQINRPLTATEGVAVYTAWYGDTIGAARATQALQLRLLTQNVGVVTAMLDTTFTLQSGSVAVRASPGAGSWLMRRSIGDTIRWHAHLAGPGGQVVVDAVGGFPVIVQNGRDVVAEQEGINENFGPRRHPRTAVGWNAQRLLLVVVDGRQPAWSVGMTLAELAALFIRLGATDAINLDGGGSSAMVIRGRVVNRPSDAQGEREVGNALVVTGCT